MIRIPITNIANQSFTIVLDGNNYNISINSCANNGTLGTDIMAVDIIRNNTAIVLGQRAVPGYPLIPYQYLQNGNLTFITRNDNYPNWRLFGVNQFLIYASITELEAIANGQSV